jgi:DNA modification methylase
LNKLYFGDNLDILREHIADETVDLIYLDPPFNSKRDYSVLFKTPKGHESDAQITAFEDSWHWGEQAEREFSELEQSQHTDVAEMMIALRKFLGTNDMMAYLTMMANRLLELHRVLKPTGSLYLHCDPTASHYLKIVLDGIFGKENFVNDISWKRTTTKTDSYQGAYNWPRIHDVLLHFVKDGKSKPVFNQPFSPYSEEYKSVKYRYKDPDGRIYRLDKLQAPGAGSRGHPQYEFMGVTRYWVYNQEKMNRLLLEGRIIQTKPGTVPQYKRYLDEVAGVAIGDFWGDISAINSQADERLGYPTQKPLALLERIINASSNPGDVVLDPFCGCGTAVHAAQKLGRQWIGIDITHLAISLIEKRLKDAFPGIKFEIEGTPKDADGARNLAERDKYQFQWWACSLVNAAPYQGKKKGADSGIDGLIFFHDDKSGAKKIVVSVKGGENVNVAMVRDLGHVVDREKASMGFFVTLAEPTRPMREEAIAAGFYDAPRFGSEYPKLQILTIEGLMNGTERPRFPDLTLGRSTFKRAAVEDMGAEQGRLI